MGNYTDSCQSVPFLNNLIVVKNGHCQWFMPNLCYIIHFDLCIGAFGLQTTFNDPCPVQFYMIFDQSDGRVVNSPFK